MAVFLTEEDVRRCLAMDDAIEAVEAAFRELARGEAANRPRSRVRLPGIVLHVMAAGSRGAASVGLKAYTTTRAGARFLFLLYAAESGEPLAVIEADRLGQMRTGAASGVATRHLARADARRVGIIGTGWQARSQLAAIVAVRPVDAVVAYGRDEARRRRFAEEMTEELGVPVRPAREPEEVAREADILVTATTSRTPVLRGAWLRPGQHVNAIGANVADKQEVDEEVVARADVIVVDSIEQARIECGDLLQAFDGAAGKSWEDVAELADVVAGRGPRRTDAAQITLFESQGVALEDVAVGRLVYDAARRRGLGTALPF